MQLQKKYLTWSNFARSACTVEPASRWVGGKLPIRASLEGMAWAPSNRTSEHCLRASCATRASASSSDWRRKELSRPTVRWLLDWQICFWTPPLSPGSLAWRTAPCSDLQNKNTLIRPFFILLTCAEFETMKFFLLTLNQIVLQRSASENNSS